MKNCGFLIKGIIVQCFAGLRWLYENGNKWASLIVQPAPIYYWKVQVFWEGHKNDILHRFDVTKQVSCKRIGRYLQIAVAFSENMNFKSECSLYLPHFFTFFDENHASFCLLFSMSDAKPSRKIGTKRHLLELMCIANFCVSNSTLDQNLHWKLGQQPPSLLTYFKTTALIIFF